MSKKWCFLFLLVIGLMWCTGCTHDEPASSYQVEYLNKDKTEIIRVGYEPKSESALDLIAEFLVLLSSDSKNVEHRKPIPNDVEVVKYTLEGAMLTIWFDQDFNRMSDTESVLCLAAIVRTMTQIDGVDCVTFYVGDKPLEDARGNIIGTLSADSFIENPGKQINSIQEATLTLYFSNKAGDGLIKEVREVHYSSNISMEKLIIDQLLKGPQTEGLKSAIPTCTKLVSVSVVDGICYVNLDSNFKNQDYSVKEAIVVYSIVNSLSELSTITNVQISVNGDTSGVYRDTLQLSNMYSRNLDYVTTMETVNTEETETIESTEDLHEIETTEDLELLDKTETIF